MTVGEVRIKVSTAVNNHIGSEPLHPANGENAIRTLTGLDRIGRMSQDCGFFYALTVSIEDDPKPVFGGVRV